MLPWLTEPGLLTARMRACCVSGMRLNLLRVTPAPLEFSLARRLGVAHRGCLHREVELRCPRQRWIYARSVFPDSTVRGHPWLAELGGNGLGETLAALGEAQHEPLEYLELDPVDDLALAAAHDVGGMARLWARRSVFRLAADPILAQEVFLNGGCAP